MTRIAVMMAALAVSAGSAWGGSDTVLWRIDNLARIGGRPVTVLGNPQVDAAQEGVIFDGEGDCLILETNPLAGLAAFTVEVVFRPDAGGSPEQRFLHFQADEEHRVLVETRLLAQSWFLDTFIKSGDSSRTLQSRQSLHPLGDWYHAALVYRGGQMRHYVNGVEELSGTVDYQPVSGGRTSIGCRLNRVHWFKGAIRSVRISERALAPGQFVR